MAKTERHRDGMISSIQTLSLHYIDGADVCVSGNLMMYHEEGDPRKSISPDVFVVFGIPKKERRIYQIWNEGKPPDFVLEYSSPNTYRRDLTRKRTYTLRLVFWNTSYTMLKEGYSPNRL